MSDAKTGAVRSSDTSHLDFTSLPIIGLFGVARTAKEGAEKYARLNYMKGFPVHDILNHALTHIYMFLAGDRSEPNLEHAAWGLLAAVQQQTLDPAHSEAHLLGPGATLTTANLNYLAEQEAVLGPKRAAGEFDGLGDWKLSEVPQIAKILDQRFCPCGQCSEPYVLDSRNGSHGDPHVGPYISVDDVPLTPANKCKAVNEALADYSMSLKSNGIWGVLTGHFDAASKKLIEEVKDRYEEECCFPERFNNMKQGSFDFGAGVVLDDYPAYVKMLPIEAESPAESLDRMTPFQSVNPSVLSPGTESVQGCEFVSDVNWEYGVVPAPLPTEFDDFRKLINDCIEPEENVTGDGAPETQTRRKAALEEGEVRLRYEDGREIVIGNEATPKSETAEEADEALVAMVHGSKRTIKTGYDPSTNTMDGIPVKGYDPAKKTMYGLPKSWIHEAMNAKKPS